MFTLPHHVEFLSDDWLAEAGRFLEQETRVRKERLGGRPFSISERFADAPPHLKLPGDVAGWAMRYDGERVEVSRDFDAAADIVVEGDYQAALMSAQFVGVLAPGGVEGSGSIFLINHNADSALITLRYRFPGASFDTAEEPFENAGHKFNRGTFIVRDPKTRVVHAAPYRDRVVHHAVCRVIEPAFERSTGVDRFVVPVAAARGA